MELHFLEARVPLVKTYTQTDEGVKKDAYPMVKHVTSHREQVHTLDQMLSALRYHSRNGHCLLKGELKRDLVLESRASETDPMAPTSWICLDFDYLKSEDQVNSLLSQMGLSDVSYIVQYGAGHKIDKPFSAHLYFMLEHEVLPETLKYWLMNQNLTLSEFEKSISLTRSNAALQWPLDVAVAHNGMLIYIAPPECVGMDDPVPTEDRLRLVRKENDKVNLKEQLAQIDSAVIEEKKNTKLSELRKKKGLKHRTFNTKLISGIEVVSKPGVVSVTGYKQGRGFMYLNLNGGDSWGYYHPLENPEILFNFKGEPNYLTKEIVPEYYKNYKKLQQEGVKDQDTVYLAFLDRRSDVYYRGTFEPETTNLDIYATSAVKKLEDFLRQHNQWVGEFVEEWDYVFRFDDNRVCVPEERFLNRFYESPYLRDARLNPSPGQFPPTIAKILKSALGDDMDVVKRFLNWLAFIVQKRRRTETAWVLSGCEGTGKGLLIHNILKPIIGNNYVNVTLMSALNENFNSFMEDCVILMLDETEQKQLDANSKPMAKLKQAITDPVVPIRKMRTDYYEAKNYMNLILASNARSAVAISDTDRRFNVAPYQETRLIMSDAEIASIESELFDFTSILYKWNIDHSVLRTPIVSQQKHLMHELSSSAVHLVLRAVQQGDLQSILDVAPTQQSPQGHDVDRIAVDNATRTIVEAQRAAKRGEKHFISRDALHVLLRTVSGDSVPITTPKFVQMLKHHGVFFERYGGKLGLEVKWQVPEFGIEDKAQLEAVK